MVGRVHPPEADACEGATGKALCGAYSRRSGKPCKNFAMANGRCRMHGGTSKGNPRLTPEQSRTCAIQHGIYADVGLLDDEYPVYDSITAQVGTLNEEIHMARVKLRRAYKAQRRLEEAREAMAEAVNDREQWLQIAIAHRVLTLDELETKEGQHLVGQGDGRELEDYTDNKLVRKVHDYTTEIRQFTILIQRLEQARKELVEGGTGGDDFVRQLAEDLRGFETNAMPLMPGSAELGAGNYTVDQQEGSSGVSD